MALEDVPGLINPIIQAMIATAQLQQRGRESEIDKEKNKEDVKLKQEGLKQALKAIEYQHEHDISQLEATRMLNEAHAKAATAETQLNWQKFIQGGGDPNLVLKMQGGGKAAQEAQRVLQSGQGLFRQPAPAQPSMGGFPYPQSIQNVLQGPQAQPVPGQNQPVPQIPQQDQNLPQNPPIGGGGYGSPQDAARIAAEREQVIEEAKNRGQNAAKARDFAYRLAEEDQKTANLMKTDKNKAMLEHPDKEKEIAGRIAVAEIMAGAKSKQPDINSPVAQSLLQLALTGQIKLSPTNPMHQAVLSAGEERGANMNFEPKDVAALVKTKELEPIFDQMEKFSNKLPAGRIGAFAQGKVQNLKEGLGISSELQNEWKIMRGQAVVIGKALEGMGGRPLAIQLAADLNSLPETGITRDDAKARIQFLRGRLQSVMDSFFAGMPDFQQDMVSKRWLGRTRTMPDWLKVAPKTHPKTNEPLDIEESKRVGKPQYKIAGGQ